MKLKTRDIDFIGCDSTIADELRCGRMVFCECWNHDDEQKYEDYVFAYNRRKVFPYLTRSGRCFNYAIPVKFPEKIIYVKPSQELYKILIEDGYNVNNEGIWTKQNHISFVPSMFRFCGKVLNDDASIYDWDEKWLDVIEELC